MIKKLAFIFIFLFIVFLRLYNVNERFIFDIDVQYQALLAKTIIEHFHIIWIGVSASTIGYYLGPGIVYVTALLLWLSKGDPVVLGYFASLIGSLTALSLYYISTKLFNRKVAVISVIIYGFSTFIIGYDRKYWPIAIPLIALWIFYALVQSQKNSRWLIVSVMLIALSYHIHMSLLLFWPFIIWSFFKLFKKIHSSTWIMSIGGYLIITLPLLFFDLVHNFDNMLMPIRFIKNFGHSTAGFHTHFGYLLTIVNNIWFANYQKLSFLPLLLTLFTLLTAFHLLSGKKKYPQLLLIFIIAIFFILFGLYPGLLQEYYAVLLFPFIAIAISLFLADMRLSLTLLFMLIFISVNMYSFFASKNTSGLVVKKNLIKKVMRDVHDDYYLSYEGNFDMEGWRYLFEVFGRTPARSKADAMFGWIYPKKISSTPPTVEVFMMSYPFRAVILPHATTAESNKMKP